MIVYRQMKKQQGAALIVSLLFVLILSVLATTGTRTTISEQMMSSNAKFHIETFQAAESVIEKMIDDNTAFDEAIKKSPGDKSTKRTYAFAGKNSEYSVSGEGTITQGGPTIALGYSIGSFTAYPFTIEATSRVTGIDAESIHVQTVQKVGPAL